MKKSFLFTILFLAICYSLDAQPACIKDVIYTLTSVKQIPKARKLMEEQCFPGNESSPDVWLVRANVFIQLYNYELEMKEKDPKYTIRWPDAIITANESFYKVLELKPEIKTDPALFEPEEGLLLTAEPISMLAVKYMDNKNYAEAIKLLNMVIRTYKYDAEKYALDLSYTYLDLSNCYQSIGDEKSCKEMLLNAAALNAPLPSVYLSLYDIYRQEKDTIKCGEILAQAHNVIPDSLAINIKGYELDYFSMVGDSIKLKSAAIKMFEQYRDNPAVITIIAGHLINNKEYSLAESMIKEGLSVAPNNFDLNQQMTYRFFYEAIDYDKLKEAKLNEKPRKYLEAEALLKKSNEILEKSVIWAEKAYNLNKDDKQHNFMYRQILVRLNLPVPDELQQKVDSYYKQ